MNLRRLWQHDLFRVSLLVLMCTFFFLFHIWMRTLSVTTGYEVGALRRDVLKLESDLSRERVDQNRLMGPESLQRLVADFAEQGSVFRAPQSAQLIYATSKP
ncbi:MAG: hypothetical protein JST16_07470 [Bdellovibrionales bacterium]|nr:hypothetical protein [Bdellovibrionales bacterium]